MRAEIKLETEAEYESDGDLLLYASYKPRQALNLAMIDWYNEMLSESKPRKKVILPTIATLPLPNPPTPIVNTCISVTPLPLPNPPTDKACIPVTNITTSLIVGTPLPIDIKHINELNNLEVNDSYMQPSMSSAPINSLADTSSSSDTESVGEKAEPMDCAITPGSTPASSDGIPVPSDIDVVDNDCSRLKSSSIMQVDTDSHPIQSTSSDCDKCGITMDDVAILVDFFYLPFEHGSNAIQMLTDFYWLKANCSSICDAKGKSATPQQVAAASNWHEQADRMREKLQAYNTMVQHLCTIPNQTVLYDLFPYVWDMMSVLSVTKTFIDWLGRYPKEFIFGSNVKVCNY